MRLRGQGTFEYVLLLGGVLLTVVIASVVLINSAPQIDSSKTCAIYARSAVSCFTVSGGFDPARTFSRDGQTMSCGCGAVGESFELSFPGGDGQGSAEFPTGGATLEGTSVLSFEDAALQYVFSPEPDVRTQLPGKLVATWFYDVPEGQEFKVGVEVVGANLQPSQRQSIDASKKTEPSVASLRQHSSSGVASQLTTNVPLSDSTSYYGFWSGANSDPYHLVFVFQAPPEGFRGSLSLPVPVPSELDAGTVPISRTDNGAFVWDEVQLAANEKFEVRVSVRSSEESFQAVFDGVQQNHPGLSFQSSASIIPSPVGSPAPTPSCVIQGQGCGLLPGSTPCCTGLSCQVEGFSSVCKPDALANPSPSPFPSPSPSANPSLICGDGACLEGESALACPQDCGEPQPSPSPSASPLPNPSPILEPVGEAAYPVAVLFVKDSENLNALESAFRVELSADYPRVVLQPYAKSNVQTLRVYPVFFVIQFDESLSASVLQALVDGGSRVNLLGSASTYASQLSLDSQPVVLPS